MVFYVNYLPPLNPMTPKKQIDGIIEDIALIDQTPEPGLVITTGSGILKTGRAIDSTHLPTRIKITGGSRAITDFDGYGGLVFVSPTFKSVIEGLEPDIHQFFEIEFLSSKMRHLADFWIWNVCNRIDSVDREHTTMVLWRGVLWRCPSDVDDDELPPGFDRSRPPKFVFSERQTRGCHFWRDKYIGKYMIFCSDEAASQMRAAKLSGVELREAETI